MSKVLQADFGDSSGAGLRNQFEPVKLYSWWGSYGLYQFQKVRFAAAMLMHIQWY